MAKRTDSPERREYLKNYQRQWLAERRTDYLADKSCVECGSTDELEVDHIDPAQKSPSLRTMNNIWSWKAERREAELAKCQVLCKPHHLQKTHGWPTTEAPHGRWRYEKYGCRCEICKYEGNRRGGMAKRTWPGKLQDNG